LFSLRRSALALSAVFVLVAAGACSSGAATFGAQGPTASNGVNPSGAGPNVDPNSPDGILTQAISGGSAIKSVHLKIEVGGTIKAAALKAAGSSTGGISAGITSDLKLDGTSLEGDIDVANQAANLKLSVAAIPEFGGVPITADLILKDQALYYKVSMLGPKYTKMPLGSLTEGLGVNVPLPTPGASALTGVTDQVAAMRKQLEDFGAVAKLVGVEQIGGKDANHINIALPIDKINAQIAAAAAGESPDPALANMKLDSAAIDFWIYKDNSQLAKVTVAGGSSVLGNLALTITLTNYDVPVSISAPPASQVTATTP
jgi:hypothetical protein